MIRDVICGDKQNKTKIEHGKIANDNKKIFKLSWKDSYQRASFFPNCVHNLEIIVFD